MWSTLAHAKSGAQGRPGQGTAIRARSSASQAATQAVHAAPPRGPEDHILPIYILANSFESSCEHTGSVQPHAD